MQGLNWYYELNDYLKTVASVYNVPLIKVAGVMSALSPNNTFRNNIVSLEKFLRHKGNCKVTCFNAQKNKAIAILNAPNDITENEIKDILGKGLKTRSFFENLYRPLTSKAVTVDLWQIRWAKKLGIMPEKGTLTNKRYKLISEMVTKLAEEKGLMPHQYQAITWSEIRGKEY